MERRKFIALALGGATAGYLGWQIGRGGTGPFAPLTTTAGRLARFQRKAVVLGTDATITVFHDDSAIAGRALDAAFAAIERVEQLMSLYRPDSQLCRLNATGRLRAPDPGLVTVLGDALALAGRSGGAFDPSVQPLWELHRASQLQGGLPRAAELERVRRQVDWRRVSLDDREIRLAGDGMRLTLNGIAQGYAADAARRALSENGITCALIDTGEVGTVGRPAGRDAWSIGIKHPRQPGELLARADLRGRCLATSGDYETRFSDDYNAHHLFDPHTGRSAVKLASVSVAARTATEADALSTAAFVLGPDDGMKLVRSTPGADALMVSRDGSWRSTPGFAHQPRNSA